MRAEPEGPREILKLRERKEARRVIWAGKGEGETLEDEERNQIMRLVIWSRRRFGGH
ncbi:hypothetical protein BDZ89DRAFT_321501 [Hymenopellis radicata]|nr:hypothetical protein BDZ89DRAFT_321501 [Hymenopellis radicata]